MIYILIFLIALTGYASESTLLARQPDTLAANRAKQPKPERRKYTPDPHVDPAVWNMLSPYFLPENSKEKAILDKIFMRRDALESFEQLFKAGFQVRRRPDDKVIVARHPKLKNRLVKMYMDASPQTEWDIWMRRVEGANAIRDAIKRHGYENLFKVPKKWIYPLPPSESSLNEQGVPRKRFVLVVEDMKILKKKKNYRAYRKKITTKHLDAIHDLITSYGLIDSVYAFNIPFCKDGKIAFVDTEWALRNEPAPVEKLQKRLRPSMRTYWDELCKK